MVFYDQRFTECWLFGSSFDVEDAARHFTTGGGNDYSTLQHPFLRYRCSVGLLNKQNQMIDDLLDFYARVGTYRAFRVKCPTEYSTSGRTGTPTFLDQECVRVSSTVYQAMVWYDGQGNTAGFQRRIVKPVAGTALVGVDGGQELSGWTMDYSTGQITFDSDPGESSVVTVGCEFDIPMRFGDDLNNIVHSNKNILSASVQLVESFNPDNS